MCLPRCWWDFRRNEKEKERRRKKGRGDREQEERRKEKKGKNEKEDKKGRERGRDKKGGRWADGHQLQHIPGAVAWLACQRIGVF